MNNIFKTKEGETVIFQKPNLPILVWLGSFLLQYVFTEGVAASVFDLLGFGALFVWAWLELFDGVNLFRRALGGGVLVASIILRIS